MTREEVRKAREHCERRARCKTCPLFEVDVCEELIQIETEHEEEVAEMKRKLNNALQHHMEVKEWARWKGAGMGDYYCSLCQHQISGRTKFCPECGAKMDEWEDDEA